MPADAVQVEHKRCSKCQEVKPADKFTRDCARADGLDHRCKECNNRRVSQHNKRKAAEKAKRVEHATIDFTDPAATSAAQVVLQQAAVDETDLQEHMDTHIDTHMPVAMM